MRPVLKPVLLALLMLAGCSAEPPAASAQGPADMTRGRALYETHCIACHTEKVHWRDPSLVRSWADLRAQVARFQRIAGQEWSEQEISDVAAYLNDQFYRMPCPVPGCGAPSAHLEREPGLAGAP
jgi:mono/diheme cytochrome c family protein